MVFPSSNIIHILLYSITIGVGFFSGIASLLVLLDLLATEFGLWALNQVRVFSTIDTHLNFEVLVHFPFRIVTAIGAWSICI